MVRACVCACMHVYAQLCPTLCNPMHCSPSSSFVHRISQARTLKWVSISSSRESSWLRGQTWVSCTACRFFTTEPLASQSKGIQVPLTTHEEGAWGGGLDCLDGTGCCPLNWFGNMEQSPESAFYLSWLKQFRNYITESPALGCAHCPEKPGPAVTWRDAPSEGAGGLSCRGMCLVSVGHVRCGDGLIFIS